MRLIFVLLLLMSSLLIACDKEGPFDPTYTVEVAAAVGEIVDVTFSNSANPGDKSPEGVMSSYFTSPDVPAQRCSVRWAENWPVSIKMVGRSTGRTRTLTVPNCNFDAEVHLRVIVTGGLLDILVLP